MIIKGFICFGWRVPLFGSNSNNGGKAGCFYVNANNGFSNINVNISTHLSLKINNMKHINHTSW